ncbi:hypothetical protein ACE193_17365 [Bernardetia sp. OM2101]|uniref:hypothetical protein n=1 Tax=Bernardetia sp. OM2101 TaxID=3344876 RepID=UPI0035D01E59
MPKDYYDKPEDFENMQVYIDKIEEGKKTGVPVAIQALWDGDTQGWCIYMEVIIDTKNRFSKYSIFHLCTMRFASDLRIFNGQPTPWEETIVAKKIGNLISKKYNIPFWFPASEAPDDDCPSWLQRDKGIHCADCNKLIIPTDSSYLPKDICYSCHLRREAKKNFSNDISTNDELTIYTIKYDLDKNDFNSYQGWMMMQGKGDIYAMIDTILDEKNIKIEEIESYSFFEKDLKKLITLYEKQIENYFEKYYEDLREDFEDDDEEEFIKFVHNGKAYFIHHFFDHDVISDTDTIKSLQSIIDENQYLYLFFSRNKTKQLDTIMGFMKGEKNTTLQKITDYYSKAENEKYRTTLSKEQINKNIQRLIERDYISIDENEVTSLTFKGNFY